MMREGESDVLCERSDEKVIEEEGDVVIAPKLHNRFIDRFAGVLPISLSPRCLGKNAGVGMTSHRISIAHTAVAFTQSGRSLRGGCRCTIVIHG